MALGWNVRQLHIIMYEQRLIIVRRCSARSSLLRINSYKRNRRILDRFPPPSNLYFSNISRFSRYSTLLG